MKPPRAGREWMSGTVAIVAAALCLWLLLAAVAALLLWNDRQGEIAEAKLRGAATTALLQAHTASTFRAVDNVLGEVAKIVERGAHARHDESLRHDLLKRLASMPYVRALFVIGPDGHIQHDTDFPATPDVSLADRPYFRQYLQTDAPVTPISAPMLSRSGLGWFVAVTRKLGDGPEFRGVAVAAIQLAYFSDLYKAVGLEEGSEILLFHRDGRLLAQHPGTPGKIGDSYASFPLFATHLPKALSGAYLTQSAPLPYLRVVNYAALADIPLVVAQTHNMKTGLSRWTSRAIATSAAMLLLLAAILYTAVYVARARRERQVQMERSIHGEKMEALGQLTGGIAHDFGNVLGVVSTNLQLIRKMAAADDRLATAVDRAQRAVQNGSSLTRQLMALGRKRELHLAPCDLNERIAAVLGLLEHAAGPECRLVFEPGELPGTCALDATQFEVALINLVVNARHAIEREGCITIRTRLVTGREVRGAPGSSRQRFARVSVADNGKGMPEEVRLRAGEPFFTTKGEDGTGFGLAQVKAMMHQSGGDLTIESEVGVGTSVNLFFPMSAAH